MFGRSSRQGGAELERPESPPAHRLRRPRWTDARLLVGAALVLGSTLTGAAVAGGDAGPQHWEAARDLPTGHVLTRADLKPVSAGDRPAHLSGTDPLGAAGGKGAVLVQPLRSGELVPRSALGSPGELDLRRVSVPVSAGSASMLAPGSVVDLWTVPEGAAGQDERPRPERVLESVEVARVQSVAQSAAAGRPVDVDLLVPEKGVAEVLAGLGDGEALAAVPVAGSLVAGEGEQ
ncbi:hypothetical protein SAMN05445756_1516 [Kytococcus aerolatus]|uniref:SAF domain-containing protein n=1 Tax=Kytococcus aerolatus TaxID=592308 RepID=A0A212U033_9MICO|nr:hypothetical protein [Kytococcus aerolatus]SNC71510.1 hypothetical protein SAMN05445756_1516 [Kytococcus aerolatus]